jgi:hypothetical protein
MRCHRHEYLDAELVELIASRFGLRSGGSTRRPVDAARRTR